MIDLNADGEDELTLRKLCARFPHPGRIEAIYLRPGRRTEVLSVNAATAIQARGLDGDRKAAAIPRTPAGGARQVTLIQAEHLPVVAAFVGRDAVYPALLLRHLVGSGQNQVAARALFGAPP